MGEGKEKSASKVEPAKQESPPAEGAKQEGDQTKAEEKVKSSKAQKNQFALNRLALMLLDVDPAELAQDMIDDLIKVHRMLDDILKRQGGESKDEPAKGPD